MSAFTGARRKISSPSASESAFRIARTAAHRRLADAARADRRLRIGNVQRGPLHVHRHIQNRRRLVVVEALGQRHAVVLVVDPLLADRVADAQRRAARESGRPARCGWITVPTSAYARKSMMWYLPVSTSTSTSAKLAT